MSSLSTPISKKSSSPLYDLLVVLGTSRFGTDWPNVSSAVKVALAPLEVRDQDTSEPPSTTECEERFRALVEGVPVELSALASKLQTQRIDALLASRVELVDRIKLLCQQLPPGHPSRPAAAFCDAPGALDGADGDEDGEGGGTSGGRGGSGGRRGGASDAAPENEIEDNWVQIAEEEERNPRRATVPGTLNKMLQAVAKHKWAYPFKRPVTDKEAPDYREVITNPMDFTTLKRRIETGAVIDVPALTADLVLIFENAMLYNGKGTDYYRMAGTLKEAVKAQQNLYNASRPEDPLAGGGRTAVGGAAGTAEEGVEAPAPPEDVTMAAADDDADAPDADADAPAEAPAEAPASSSAAAPRRGGRRGARG